jgi:hypothetical protein
MAGGRPSEYTPEIAEAICIRLASGESLRSVCTSDDMPDKTTVLRWLARNEEFRTQYARSKEESAEAIAEEYFDILDEMPPAKADGSLDSAAVAWAKNRADGRKWYLSKIMPKKYGDKVQTEHSGSIQLTDLTEEDLDRRIEALKNAEG